ncbi:hypothetical protein ACB098_01G169600 [Castanea mollissima]
MEMFRVQFLVMAIFAIVLALAVLSINAQSLAPAPGPSTGVAIDQGIAYTLMVLALLLTYMIH